MGKTQGGNFGIETGKFGIHRQEMLGQKGNFGTNREFWDREKGNFGIEIGISGTQTGNIRIQQEILGQKRNFETHNFRTNREFWDTHREFWDRAASAAGAGVPSELQEFPVQGRAAGWILAGSS